MKSASQPPVSRTAQRGLAALEFSLVCVLFLVVLFGIVSYGGLFVAQQALSRAAEEGARVALQSASLAPNGTPSQDDACGAATRSVEWLSRHRALLGQGPVSCELQPARTCIYAADLLCAAVVVRYPDYRRYPLIPEVLPLGSWMQALFGEGAGWLPENLSAAATVQLGKSPSGA